MTEPSQGPGEGEHGDEGRAALQQVHGRQRLRADAVEEQRVDPTLADGGGRRGDKRRADDERDD
jgi:hypothetical protein